MIKCNISFIIIEYFTQEIDIIINKKKYNIYMLSIFYRIDNAVNIIRKSM